MAEAFSFYDTNFHEINEDGYRIVKTSNKGVVVIDWEKPQEEAYFGFKCPRGNGQCNYLRIRGGPADDGKRPSWDWDGNRDNPTFKPSINCQSHNPKDPAEKYAGCGWHGYIKAGKLDPEK